MRAPYKEPMISGWGYVLKPVRGLPGEDTEFFVYTSVSLALGMCMYIYIHTYECICIYIYKHIYICVYIHAYIYIYTYIYSCIPYFSQVYTNVYIVVDRHMHIYVTTYLFIHTNGNYDPTTRYGPLRGFTGDSVLGGPCQVFKLFFCGLFPSPSTVDRNALWADRESLERVPTLEDSCTDEDCQHQGWDDGGCCEHSFSADPLYRPLSPCYPSHFQYHPRTCGTKHLARSLARKTMGATVPMGLCSSLVYTLALK